MTLTKQALAALTLLWAVGISSLAAQQPAAPSSATSESPARPAKPAPSASEIQRIISTFAANEDKFVRARDNYTYHQTFKVQELDQDGGPTDRQLVIESDIIFTPSGARAEKVTYAPTSTLRRLSLTPEDERDLKSRVAFIVTTAELPKYDIRYQGRQKVDELDTYVFRITPKVLEKGERYFDGMIWVDDEELQIVKSYGKSVPDSRNNYSPRYETYRELIDGKYRFPTWTGADDKIPATDGGGELKFRAVVKYDNYKQFKSDANITYGDEVPDPAKK